MNINAPLIAASNKREYRYPPIFSIAVSDANRTRCCRSGPHPRQKRTSHLGTLGGEVEGEQADREEGEDRAQSRSDTAEDVRLVLLQVVVDMRGRVGGSGSLGRREHGGVEVGTCERVQLVHIRWELLHDLIGLSRKHGGCSNAEQQQRQEHVDEQQARRASSAPAALLV
jgi:hypothetical protein